MPPGPLLAFVGLLWLPQLHLIGAINQMRRWGCQGEVKEVVVRDMHPLIVRAGNWPTSGRFPCQRVYFRPWL